MPRDAQLWGYCLARGLHRHIFRQDAVFHETDHTILRILVKFPWHIPDFPIYSNGTKPGTLHTVSRIAPNILDRNFTRDKPNTAWVSDITEFNIAGRKVYLCPVMDLFDRTIISHTVSTSAATTLAVSSLKESITAQAPEPGWIIHTDQGFQFQHIAWRTLVEKHEGKVSMSRKGNCYDNAVIENFFSHLKTEMYHGETFNNIKEFTNAIDEYINWYNNQRLQERLKGQTPMQYRNQTLQALTA